MNIVILANRDLAANFALHQLAPHLNKHNTVLMLSNGIGKNNNTPQLQALKEYEQQLQHQLYQQQYTQNAFSQKTATGQTGFYDFESLTTLYQWQLADCSNANTPEAINVLVNHQTHLLISIRYGHILQHRAINSASFEVINLHSGALPQYRGVMASFWALLKDETKLATSVHTIDSPDIDQGRLLGSDFLAVNREKSYLWHVLSLYIEGSRSVAKTIEKIDQGINIKDYPRLQQGQYFSYPSRNDIDHFHSKGLFLFKEEERPELMDLCLNRKTATV